MSFLFGKKPVDPKEQSREWIRKLKHEKRQLDRQIDEIKRAENKIILECKRAVKTGDQATTKMFARELVRSRKAKERLMTSGAQINSLCMQITQQLATMRLAQTMGQSVSVMTAMNALCHVPELSAVAREMSKEMMKAGLIEEMIDDAMTGMDSEDLDEEADAAIEKIIDEITTGAFADAGTVGGRVRAPAQKGQVRVGGAAAAAAEALDE